MDRFWNKVNKTGTCWLWTGCVNKNGYGVIKINRKYVRSHRISWELCNGLIPKDLCVLHKCDVRHCVNPKHLFLGSRDENNKDRANKNRSFHSVGELSTSSVLKEKDIKEIRGKYIPYKYSANLLAKEYEVAQTTIINIIKRKTWKHI